MLKKSFISLSIRFSTVFLKFIFLVYFAKKLPVSDLGIYGLFVITVSFVIYVLGLDFYQFNTREILKTENPINLLCNQLALHVCTYVVVIPISLALFYFDFLPGHFLILYVFLVICEHLSQEIYRLLIILSMPISGNIVLFLRNGLWVLCLLLLFYIYNVDVNLTYIILTWLVGSFLSVLYGTLKIWNYFSSLKTKTESLSISITWIIEGLKTSIYFFGTSLLLKGIEFSDRYFIKYFRNELEVGTYTFYYSLAGVLNTFVITGTVAILAPKLIKAFQSNDLEKYRSTLRTMTISVIASIVVIVIGIILTTNPLLDFIDKTDLAADKKLLYIILAYISVNLIGLIPQYRLYVHGKDQVFFYINLTSFVVGMILNFSLVPFYGTQGAAFSTLMMFCLLTILKFIYASHLLKDEKY